MNGRFPRSAPALHPFARGLWLLVVCLGGMAGCASTQNADPWQGMNRKVQTFNDTVDRWVLKPVAKGYDKVLPNPVKRSVANFFVNLGTPMVAVNQLLQGKPMQGLNDTMRFVTNSTIGIAGLFDVAARAGLPANDEDFGQTFSVWGAGSGPYIVIPFRGPSTGTDAVGLIFDALTNPLRLLSPPERYVVYGVDVVDTRRQLLSAEELISGDRYLFLRDAYLQRREFLVNDGRVEEDPFADDYDDFEDQE
ncbi:MAG: VacJ family lipoprotein [Pseudomonadales bacterium]